MPIRKTAPAANNRGRVVSESTRAGTWQVTAGARALRSAGVPPACGRSDGSDSHRSHVAAIDASGASRPARGLAHHSAGHVAHGEPRRSNPASHASVRPPIRRLPRHTGGDRAVDPEVRRRAWACAASQLVASVMNSARSGKSRQLRGDHRSAGTVSAPFTIASLHGPLSIRVARTTP